jgi:cysteine desulfurase
MNFKYSPIYLDYAATTPLHPMAREAMLDVLTHTYGNSASLHETGKEALQIIEASQKIISEALHCEPSEIIFTSGATESNNLAIKGLTEFYAHKGKHIITQATEHKSVLEACYAIEKKGYDLTYLPVDHNGTVSLDSIEKAIRQDTLLISIMHVNNETGIIQDIEAIAKLAKSRGVFFHTDATQSVGKMVLDLQKTPVDLLSFSAHKCYGPKGIGALFVRQKPKVGLRAQMDGGKHQKGLRSGTLPTHQIVGFATALAETLRTQKTNHDRIIKLRKKLLSGLLACKNISLNTKAADVLPHIINLHIEGMTGEALMKACPMLCFSLGATCNAAQSIPSSVLTEMGYSVKHAQESIRLSIGNFTTEEDIEKAIELISSVIA